MKNIYNRFLSNPAESEFWEGNTTGLTKPKTHYEELWRGSNNTIDNWQDIARDKQKIPEGDWFLWMIMAGRGFGKTRTGAESIMELVNSGKYKRIGIIGKNIREVKQVMVEGMSGILSTTIASKMNDNKEKGIDDPDIVKFRYYPSKNQIEWENGAKAYLISGDNPDSLRGYQFDLIWMDEYAKYSKPKALWEQVMFTLRIGDNPRCIMTTTPKPLKILMELMEEETTYVTNGSTFENEDNLSHRFIEGMKNKYEGTHLGKQELLGILVMEKENAVWKKENIVYKDVDLEDMERVVIGVDPAVTCNEHSDETGIIVAGMGYDERFYIIDDLSGKYKPPDWAKVVVRACHDYKAGRVVAETNNGGDLVEEMINTINPYVPVVKTKAIKGKVARAEPVSLLYEANKIFHKKEFTSLEEQMCNLSYDDENNGDSPDRVDALVWAISELKEKKRLSNELRITTI
jgi:predicted phage terminase large subunit-like protein